MKRMTDTPKDNYITGDGVDITSIPGYNGPLCEKLTIQVEFWKLVYGVAPDKSGPTLSDGRAPDYYFSITPVKRRELRVDAATDKAVALPPGLYAEDRSPCVGALVTITIGKRLKDKELPKEIGVTGSVYGDTEEVDFRTKRVADYELSPPKAPRVCSPEGEPTADPNVTPVPGALPTDIAPSLDLEDLMPDPSP
ncbi:hypothetical protein GCM10023083_05120 [Streptomyces phyllanthi]